MSDTSEIKAGRLLAVSMEWLSETETVYFRLKGDETPKELKGIAEDTFFNRFNYGYSIVDEPYEAGADIEEL